ncbi:5-oxoprolinase subunit PxpB [Deinococcus koreensis]|uniref:Urea carboxylase n=1 Tax=Deinococcus koreensis TaxID=2054903 RepID=A0A2K3USK7_9DEIO|nr:5-oxoprolinase subunit PxpB [Deinococcus koreensis]PNY79531.1 urea carboxylase [Deinococcus koreensis]
MEGTRGHSAADLGGLSLPSGFYVQFADRLDLTQNARLHALHRALRQDLPPGVTDLCPGYVNLYVEFDAAQVAPDEVRAWVGRHLRGLDDGPAWTGRALELPVRYDGMDLADVAARTGLDEAEVVRRHSGREYHVYAVGFTPGFPFMGEVHESLQLPRRATPRPAVPFNAVAIAAAQTCVYPLPSPGGWNLIGTLLSTVYDPHRPEPFTLAPGDRVRFVPADGPAPELPAIRELWPRSPQFPALRVERAGLLDLLMDAGRMRQGHHGLARSGFLDEWAAGRANRLVGNAPGTPLLELTLRGPRLTALRDVRVAVSGFGLAPLGWRLDQPFGLRAGETLEFRSTSSGARAYLALAGGLETSPFLGSSSVDLLGRVGRALQAGDVLGLEVPGRAAEPVPAATPTEDEPCTMPGAVRLRLLPGPQATLDALQALGRAPFRITGLDRMGLRLSGPPVPGGQVISEATPLGAVQVTPAGDPIVLLADRGRLGGYSKPAVIHPLDLPLAAQLRPGQSVHLIPDLSGPPDVWAWRWHQPLGRRTPGGLP